MSAFSVAKTDEDRRLVFGWASVSADLSGQMIEDLQGDMLDIDELEHAAYDYVLEFRDAGERHDPEKRKMGRLVESIVFTPEKLAAMGVPDSLVKKAWWVGFKIDDDQAWEKIKAGEYEMFSIEGKAVREEVAKIFSEIVEKFNSNHDQGNGQFSSGSAGAAAAPATQAASAGGVLGKLSGGGYALTRDGFAQFKSTAAAKQYSEECGKRVKLSPDQKDSLEEYQVSSAIMNNRLRAGDMKSDGYKIKDIDQAIGKSKLPDNVLLFRGIDKEGFKALGIKSNSEADLKELVGKPLSDKAYMSTTADRAIMEKFVQSPAGGAGVGIIIKASKGANALPVSAGNGQYGNRESEFILPRNATLKITGVVTQGNRSYLVAQYGDAGEVGKSFAEVLSEQTAEPGSPEARPNPAKGFREVLNAFNGLFEHKAAPVTFREAVEKFNPYHDRIGRFSSSHGASFFTYKPGASRAHDLAIDREKKKNLLPAKAPEAQKPLNYLKFSTSSEKSKKDMDRYIDDTGKKQLAKWDKKGKAAIEQYTGSSYEEMNNAMRAGKKCAYQESIDTLKKALDHESLPDSLVTYRGMSTAAVDELKRQLGTADPKKMVGAIFSDKAFNSVSLDKGIANSFAHGNVVMEIKLPAGSKAVVTDGESVFPHEKEVIVQSGAQYKITGVRKNFNKQIYQVELVGTD